VTPNPPSTTQLDIKGDLAQLAWQVPQRIHAEISDVSYPQASLQFKEKRGFFIPTYKEG